MDFGPADAFWLFACERLNGILGSVPTNHRSIETQLMRKFSISQQAIESLSDADRTEIDNLLRPFYFHRGSLKHEELVEVPRLERLSIINVADTLCTLQHPIKESYLGNDELEAIDGTLRNIFHDLYVRTLLLHKYCSAIHLNGELYGSLESLHSSSALVYARLANSCDAAPAFVQQYLSLNILLNNSDHSGFKHETVYLARVLWLNAHEQKNWFGASTEVWRKFSANDCKNDFLPINDILCRCAYIFDTITFSDTLEETVTVVVRLNNFHGL